MNEVQIEIAKRKYVRSQIDLLTIIDEEVRRTYKAAIKYGLISREEINDMVSNIYNAYIMSDLTDAIKELTEQHDS